MKKIALFLAVSMSGELQQVQYKPANSGSSVQFKIKNMGFNVSGRFTGLDGNIAFDPARPTEASFDVSIDANTINTDNETRDNHLRGDSYFDVQRFPRIRFQSAKVTPSSKKNVYFLFGRLTIKGQAKDISFPFSVAASGTGYLFTGSFNINRKDFGVGGTSIISDNLEVSLSVLAR